jgi:hypothetical protein
MGETKRNKVFETNSSSTHSISIEVGQNWDNIELNDKGNIVLEGGEFGWEERVYTDALTKANYCAVDSLGDDTKQDMLKEVIKEYTGAKEVEILASDESWDSPYYSYIDHQSAGESEEAFSSHETLKNFIFNKSSCLQTDNDNH